MYTDLTLKTLGINGKIHADGATFTSNSTDPNYYWAAIYISYSNPGGDGNYIRNCTISQCKFGMTVYSSSLNEISNNTFAHCLNPIRLTGNSNVSQISSNHLYDNLEDGIVIYFSAVGYVNNNTIDNISSTYSGRDGIWIYVPTNQPLLTNNTITNGLQDGVRCECYAAPNFGGPYGTTSTPGWNKITSNVRYGVYAQDLTQPFLGDYDQGTCQFYGGSNTIKWNRNKQLYVSSSSQIVYAEWNYWGVDPDNGNQGFTTATMNTLFGNTYPLVVPAQSQYDYHPSIVFSDPGFKKSHPSSLSVESSVAAHSSEYSTIPVAGVPVNRERILLTLADQLMLSRLYDKAITVYDSLIQRYPASDEAEAALVRIHYAMQTYNDAVKDKRIAGSPKDRFQYFKVLVAQKASTRLEQSAMQLAAINAAAQGEIQQAVTINRQIANRWSNSEHEKHALASLAELYWRSGDKKNATLSLAALQSRYAGDPVTQLVADMGYMIEHFAQGDLSRQNTASHASNQLENKYSKKVSEQINASQPTETGLRANYPNPFNPATTIVYNVSEPGTVQLFVFDILGRKATELVNGYQNEGEHRILFDGTSLPSGVYFARLEFGGKQFNQRLILME